MKRKILYTVILAATTLAILSCEIEGHGYRFYIRNHTDSIVAIRIEKPIEYHEIDRWTETENGKLDSRNMIIYVHEFNSTDTVLYLSKKELLSLTPTNDRYSGNLESDNFVPVWDYIKSIKIGKKELPKKEYTKEKWKYHCWVTDYFMVHEYNLLLVSTKN